MKCNIVFLKSEVNFSTRQRKEYDYEAWFWGKGKPMGLGYKLGLYFAEEIFRKNPNISHKDLLNKSAKELLRLNKISI